MGANKTVSLIHDPSGLEVFGVGVEPDTRCLHYFSARDIIAIRFKCCGEYYSCHSCHQAEADHPSVRWPKSEFDVKAILCGACGVELTIYEYLASGSKCPSCETQFNPNCALHYSLYFEVE